MFELELTKQFVVCPSKNKFYLKPLLFKLASTRSQFAMDVEYSRPSTRLFFRPTVRSPFSFKPASTVDAPILFLALVSRSWHQVLNIALLS